ncbi:transposase [Microtetraspora malaysiensis]|uniref:transposase n=1 Tax=Microtetraspora malaysiensis TaxID=161358 RepID=UPI003D90592D
MGELSHFRRLFYACLNRRRDELVDAVICAHGSVTPPLDLKLVAEHRRGHGTLYDGLNNGRLRIGRFRPALAGLPLPKAAGDRPALAVDVSNGCGRTRPPARHARSDGALRFYVIAHRRSSDKQMTSHTMVKACLSQP